MVLKQASRFLSIQTPLGEDALLLTEFSGHEELSRLFQFDLGLISDRNDLSPQAIVGKGVTFGVKLQDDSERHFHGIVNRFSAGDEEEGRRNYRLSIVPWLWFLTQTSDCRIFQNKTVVEIIEQIFQDLGYTDFETDQIQGDHKEWEYCVQYRETDFHFVSRLMELEGIFYYFRHEQGRHVLVMGDQAGAYHDCLENKVDFPSSYSKIALTDHLTSWEHQFEFRPGKWAQTDYNFTTPSTDLMSKAATVVDLPGNDKFEVYDYPGAFRTTSEGETETRIRMEEEEVGFDTVRASSLCKSFTPGGKFSIGVHRSSSEEGKGYVITSIRHQATEPHGYETGKPGAIDYVNHFNCIPDSVVFRPARITKKPTVAGAQTALVVGPSGEEIFVDEYGRIKVQFYWDREGKKDEASSCWVRVSQNWAGENWGIVFHPRIGQEVIVDFLEGDPDRPIVVGRVYNAQQMPPYELPANKTQSGIKSRSSPGGSSDNFNEIRFEDLKGEEEMYIHAEKDQNTVVENDQGIYVGRDRTEEIERDRRLTVGRDKYEVVQNRKSIQVMASHSESIGATMDILVGSTLTETIGLNYVSTVGAAMTLSVGGALAISVGAAVAQTIGGAKSEAIGGSKSETIGGGRSANVGGSSSESVGRDKSTEVAKDLTVTVGGQIKETAGKEYILNAKKIQLVAKDEINFKTGKAEIVMKKNGDIVIKGAKISAKGSGDVIIKGSKIKEN